MKRLLLTILVVAIADALPKNVSAHNLHVPYRYSAGIFKPVADCKQCIVLCEQSQNRILILDIPSREIIWEWKAKNSNVAPEHISWFDFPDEAKPVYKNNYILITASGGGVALVRIADKKTIFYAHAGGNPHSAEILPDGNIVCASSTGNYLTLFKVDTLDSPVNIFSKSYPIVDGHNVVWDKKRQVLWAGSGKQLQAFSYNFNCEQPDLELSDSVSLPGNLHDLFPVYKEDALWLTTRTNVFKFSLDTKQFEPASVTVPANVKSVSSGPAGFPMIIIRPKEEWWTDTILSSQGEIMFIQEGLKIYKARWLLENVFGYPSDQRIKICH